MSSAAPEPLTESELTALALAADPDIEVGDDAVCLWDLSPAHDDQLLPAWYMPARMAGSRPLQGWRRRAAWLIVAAFVFIAVSGLCNTYGQLLLG